MDTRHPDEGTIHSYVEGQLPPAERARVDEHVADCADCAAAVADARGLIAAASRIVGALDDVPGKVVPARRVRRLPPWIAAAAVVVFAVGVSSVAVRSSRDVRVSTPAAVVSDEAKAEVSDRRVSELSTPSQPREGTSQRATIREQAAAPATVASSVPSRSPISAPSRSAVSVPSRPAGPPSVEADVQRQEVAVGIADPSAEPSAAMAPAPAADEPARARAPRAVATRSLERQDVTIMGRVLSDLGQPLAGANVFINEMNISVGTDAAGSYTITISQAPLSGQSVPLRARAIGYAPQSQPVPIDAGVQTVNFELRREFTQLSEVVVSGVTTATERARVSREAAAPASQFQAGTGGPLRTVRYESSPGVVLELREFPATVPVPQAEPGVNQYRWTDGAETRIYVLSGDLTVAELESLARRLGELKIVP